MSEGNWQPISSAPRDRTILLYQHKARYPMVFGRWNERVKQWQSEPGAWPMRPSEWAEKPDSPA